MKSIALLATLAAVANALINDINEDCIVINPIGNTIVTAGEKMKIAWTNSHVANFSSIYLVQSDGNTKPVVIAENVPTSLGHITVQLPKTLIPSNAYYMTLGSAPKHCQSGNLRIVGASSRIPDPKPPSTLNDQISSGRFPIQVSNPNGAKMLSILPTTVLIATIVLTIMHLFG